MSLRTAPRPAMTGGAPGGLLGRMGERRRSGGTRRALVLGLLMCAAPMVFAANATAFEPLVQFGGPGPGGAGQLSGNGGIGVDGSGNVYVPELGRSRVSEFSTSGDFVRAFGYDVIPGGGAGFEVCTMATTCKSG